MRISCIKGQEGYNECAIAAIGRLTVNGQEVQRTVAFDDVAGWVDVYDDRDWNKTIRKYGKVEIEYRAGWTKEKLLSWGEKK